MQSEISDFQVTQLNLGTPVGSCLDEKQDRKMKEPITNGPALRMGGSVCAIKYNEGVIFGADSRLVRINEKVVAIERDDFSDKVTRLNGSIYMGGGVFVAELQSISSEVKSTLSEYRLNNSLSSIPVEEAARLVAAETCKKEFKAAFEYDILVGGWDNLLGSKLFRVCHGKWYELPEYGYSGSGSKFISEALQNDGRFQSTWKGIDLPTAEAIATKAIRYACKKDNILSGGALNLIRARKNWKTIVEVYDDEGASTVYL